MADKPITLDELRKLSEDGADVEIERKPKEIARFDDLVKAVQAMVANEAERIRADIARNQTNLEILATLQTMVKKQGQQPKAQPVDFAPLVAMLDDMRMEREVREQAAYKFEVKRDGRGFAQEIMATPVGQTTH